MGDARVPTVPGRGVLVYSSGSRAVCRLGLSRETGTVAFSFREFFRNLRISKFIPPWSGLGHLCEYFLVFSERYNIISMPGKIDTAFRN